jgi:YspA, cpYpsA-related SLOG family
MNARGLRIIVCGGRCFSDRELVFRTLDRLHAEEGVRFVIHGACRLRKNERPGLAPDEPPFDGADGLADEWALARGVHVSRNPADWSQGRRGGPVRNEMMLGRFRPDAVIAFPGRSGTHSMIGLAMAARVWIIQVRADGTIKSRGARAAMGEEVSR